MKRVEMSISSAFALALVLHIGYPSTSHLLTGIVTGLLITKGPLNFLLSGELPTFFQGGGIQNERGWGGGVASGGRHAAPGASGGSRNQPTAAQSVSLLFSEFII